MRDVCITKFIHKKVRQYHVHATWYRKELKIVRKSEKYSLFITFSMTVAHKQNTEHTKSLQSCCILPHIRIEHSTTTESWCDFELNIQFIILDWKQSVFAEKKKLKTSLFGNRCRGKALRNIAIVYEKLGPIVLRWTGFFLLKKIKENRKEI